MSTSKHRAETAELASELDDDLDEQPEAYDADDQDAGDDQDADDQDDCEHEYEAYTLTEPAWSRCRLCGDMQLTKYL